MVAFFPTFVEFYHLLAKELMMDVSRSEHVEMKLVYERLVCKPQVYFRSVSTNSTAIGSCVYLSLHRTALHAACLVIHVDVLFS